ncbi:hypothetical protein evm_002049 [Chilo suppressalis]|nr:hypothetical protein evm_002049 [Chilo suppressalis]
MDFFNKIALLATMCLIASVVCQIPQSAAHTSQGRPHENQYRSRRQAQDSNIETEPPTPPISWVECDLTTTPVLSCSDCSTLMICKYGGGLLKPCRDPLRPHCNKGTCSDVAADGC